MMIIEILKTELKAIEGGIEHLDLNDMAWHRDYVTLCKKKRIIKKAIKKLQKLEENR